MLLLDISLSVQDYAIIISINGVITFLISEWTKNKIKSGFDKTLENYKAEIKKELDKNLEDYKFSLKTREQAIKISELFSIVYSKPEKASLNKLIWELSLWLPEEIVIDISNQLTKKPDSKDVKQILMDIRKLLLDKPNSQLKAEDIIHFT